MGVFGLFAMKGALLLMSRMTVREISSLLSSRHAFPKTNPVNREDDPPHRNWDFSTRAVLVILWGLLVYPQIDPDLKAYRQSGSIRIDRLVHLFREYVGDRDECERILSLLQKHDYIRFSGGERIIPGTNLLVAVDAAKMYKYFRASVLSRHIFQWMKDQEPQ
jgi:hypothetical protein